MTSTPITARSPSSPYAPALQRALAHALAHLDALDQAPVGATSTLAELRARLAKPLADEGLPAEQVIDELVTDSAGGILGSAGGRFFGWVIGGSVPAALAADWLTSTWEQNAAIYACGPAEAVIEEVAGAWLKELLGVPEQCSFAFTSGCQMAHMTSLAAARNALLARCGWDVERKGLSGAPALRVLSSNQRHGSIERAVRMLGIGNDHVHDLEVDAHGQLDPLTLREALETQPGAPTIVILQAGDLNIGTFDPFDTLIGLAHEYQAWVHIDGAFGLWVAVSDKYRHLLSGYAQADSWATDGHKWLNVPFDSGFAFVAHPSAHRHAMSHRASYVPATAEARDQIDWNPEWSRRGRGVATYAAIRQLGRRGIAAMIERCCQHAHTLVRRIGALPGAQVIWEGQVNQGLVRFLDPHPGADEADHDARTDAVIAGILATGEALFSGTTWRGKRCMRVSVVNWQTNDEDVTRAIEAARVVLTK